MAPETSQTLDRGLQVLDVLAETPSGLSVTELAKALGVSRTVIYRLIVTLEGRGYIRRARDGRCRLGMTPVTLARQVNPMIRDAAMPALKRLSEQMAAGAHLSLVDGRDAVVIAGVEPPRPEMSAGGVRVLGRPIVDRAAVTKAALAAKTAITTAETGWLISGSGAQGSFLVTAPVLGVPGISATVTLASQFEIEESQAGPRVVQAASDIARALK